MDQAIGLASYLRLTLTGTYGIVALGLNQREGVLVSSAANTILAPTGFSLLQ